MNRDDRTFGQGVQLTVRHDGGHFYDHIVIRIQAGHFEVDPDQVLVILHGNTP